MKRYFIIFLIVVGVIAPSMSAQNIKKKVAVYVTGDVEAGYKKVIGSKLVSGITRSKDYTAVERTADFLAEMAKEQDYQMSGNVSDSQIAKLGQQFGVKYVLVADVSEVFGTIFASGRMIDVQTGQIMSSAEGSLVTESIEGISDLSNAIAYSLINSTDDIKIVGPFNTVFDLYRYEELLPKGYRILSEDEIRNMQKVYRHLGKRFYTPIYFNISIICSDESIGSYRIYRINGSQFNEDSTISNLYYSIAEYFGSMRDTHGQYPRSNGQTTQGYIYLVKE